MNKIMKIVSNDRVSYEKIYIKKFDITVLLGGSMFIQNDKYIKKSILENSKKYYIIGSNFGPYNTSEYHKYYENIFRGAIDICFREKHSYNLFKDLPNVRYASDIVFSMDISDIKITNNKKVVISVIECERKASIVDKEKYENKMVEMSKYFIEKGYEVTLMSYCKSEKDEEAIESILTKCDSKLKERISVYYYTGNIEEALNVMGDCQIVVGARFHANIIGLLLGKTIIPIAYSDKTINVLNDMNFKGRVLKVQDIDRFDVNSLTEDDLNYKHDISFQIKDAQKQFERLDELLNKKD
ncbi:MAG: polysaccharide pyruvyl transferase family protein [Clostridia bacterium]|nr:polysaccharide pyruvyl transferase family protein [Clostridia bacterium]